MDVTGGLLIALCTTFLVIIFGFILGKMNILDRSGRQVVGALIVKLVLPCLILKAMATLDFSSVRWLLILGVALGKLAVLLIVIFVTMIASGFSFVSFAQGGLRGILGVQSNDFALGLPILSALYPVELTNYLYLFAPINFLMVYPISLFLLEFGTRKAGMRPPSRLGFGLSIVIAIFKSPVVIATFLGVALNFIFKQNLPAIIEQPLALIGSAFNALALLNLGANMVGKASQLKGPNLMKSLAVVLAKSVLLPILIALFLSLLNQRMISLPERPDDDDDTVMFTTDTANYFSGAAGDDDDDHGSMKDKYFLNLFGFIYGTFPSAPGALPFAQQYGVDIDLAASVVVVGTVIAAPLMFISAKMATITVTNAKVASLQDLVSDAGINLSTASIVAAVLFIALYAANNKFSRTIDRLYVLFAVLCVGLGITANTCTIDSPTLGSDLRFSASWFFIFATRITAIVIGFHLLALAKNSVRFRLRACSSTTTIGISVCLPLLLVGLVFLIEPTISPGKGITCSLLAGTASFYTALTILCLCTLSLVYIILSLGRHRSRSARSLPPPTPTTTTRRMTCERGHSCGAHNAASGMQHGACANCCQCPDTSAGTEAQVVITVNGVPLDDTNGGQPSTSRRAHTHRHSSDSGGTGDDETQPLLLGQRTRSSINATGDSGGTNFAVSQTSESDVAPASPMGLRHLAVLSYWALSSLLGMCSCLWVLTNGRTSGIYFEVLFLDYALLNAQGVVLFLALGTRGDLLAVIGRVYNRIEARVRSVIYGTEEVAVLDTDQALNDVLDVRGMRQALAATRDELIGTRTHRLRKYNGVLVGSELVTHLCDTKIASSKQHASRIGRALVAHGVLSHVTQEHHFHDAHYFYRWNEEDNSGRASIAASSASTPIPPHMTADDWKSVHSALV
ncbi:hypothetical protein PTSG_03537 [Salpingoeca rosetta]|uniref:DEP domain-containing protein n=1 Tax=Salpingoeca rosetta (strain ATCC 50818 / BSB-021) TaxID=946362 RepID=F2U5W4_SALR5|nr:uncharacterized protein PTSG_03537 [Salpingoeca rosetta]EGD82905.1 hypothetical protein PTSG_03537 [Salpingoeca rosetta]|eukprot:XP_004995269.1 hypothetical protein PTSG_03537 [Salpingoeca rosetta]